MTDTRAYDYCKVFVRHDDPSSVTTRLASILDATVERHSLLLPGLILDVRRNSDADGSAGDDFVRWPVIIDAESDGADSGSPMSDTVATILTAFWDAGIPTVAACDFEDELPWSGGIRRLDA